MWPLLRPVFQPAGAGTKTARAADRAAQSFDFTLGQTLRALRASENLQQQTPVRFLRGFAILLVVVRHVLTAAMQPGEASLPLLYVAVYSRLAALVTGFVSARSRLLRAFSPGVGVPSRRHKISVTR